MISSDIHMTIMQKKKSLHLETFDLTFFISKKVKDTGIKKMCAFLYINWENFHTELRHTIYWMSVHFSFWGSSANLFHPAPQKLKPVLMTWYFKKLSGHKNHKKMVIESDVPSVPVELVTLLSPKTCLSFTWGIESKFFEM